ncbi:hypothetical protein H9627_02780 [Corynebacterium sp. Sa1YVA5]|uniref:Uncharacterized protein n=1 Tax=Corynebacterium gallinarum TaxID=2762214 RepID=A0A8I0HM93_9CORY|nr:hypothetical protein [Corynebacterium gallinarum]
MPPTIRWGGIIALIQSGIGLAYAFFLIYREFTGQDDPSIVYESAEANTWVGFGTAVFFIIIFGTVFAGALSMMSGRRWGRGPIIMLNIIFFPVAYYMFSEGRYLWAAIVALSAAACLAMLFNARSVHWMANQY